MPRDGQISPCRSLGRPVYCYQVMGRQCWKFCWDMQHVVQFLLLKPGQKIREALLVYDCWFTFPGHEVSQYVLWFGDRRCCPRGSRAKHRRSRVPNTYWFPECSVNKCFVIYQESKRRERNNEQDRNSILFRFGNSLELYNVSHYLCFCSGLCRNEGLVTCLLYFCLTNQPNVLGKWAIHDLNNWALKNCYWWIWQKHSTRVTMKELIFAWRLTNIDNKLYCYSNEFPNHLCILTVDKLISRKSRIRARTPHFRFDC